MEEKPSNPSGGHSVEPLSPSGGSARSAEKQRSREEDELALERGEKTREDLRRENGAFAFPNVRIDFDGVESLA